MEGVGDAGDVGHAGGNVLGSSFSEWNGSDDDSQGDNKEVNDVDDDNEEDDNVEDDDVDDEVIREGARQVLLGLRTESGRVLLRSTSTTTSPASIQQSLPGKHDDVGSNTIDGSPPPHQHHARSFDSKRLGQSFSTPSKKMMMQRSPQSGSGQQHSKRQLFGDIRTTVSDENMNRRRAVMGASVDFIHDDDDDDDDDGNSNNVIDNNTYMSGSQHQEIPRRNSYDLKDLDEEIIIINDSETSFDRFFVSGSARRRLKQKHTRHRKEFESLEYSTYRTGYGREAVMRKELNWNVDKQRYDIHIPRMKVIIGWMMLLLIATILGCIFFIMALTAENIYGARWGTIFYIASITTSSSSNTTTTTTATLVQDGGTSNSSSSISDVGPIHKGVNPEFIKGMMALFPVFVVLNMSLACASSLLVVYLSPGAQGSGLPEMRAYLNGIRMDGALSMRALIAKVFGNIFATSSGLLVGKEGPLLQIGCIVASLLTQSVPSDNDAGKHDRRRLHASNRNDNHHNHREKKEESHQQQRQQRNNKSLCSTSRRCCNTTGHIRHDNLLAPFRTNVERRDLVTAGAATGIAVGFNAPIGGIIFAFEQVSTWWRNELTWKTFFACAIGVIILRMFNGLCSNSSSRCGYYAPAREFAFWNISFNKKSMQPDSGSFIHIMIDNFPVLVIGLVCGLLGALYVSINSKLLILRKRYTKSASWKLIVDVILISLLTSAVTFWLPLFAGQCHSGVTSTNFGNGNGNGDGDGDNSAGGNVSNFYDRFIQYNCPAGEYNDLALLFTASQTNSIKRLYTSPSDNVRSLSLQSLAIFGCQIFTLVVVTNGSAIPSGIFTPCILIGAVVGRICGIFLNNLHFVDIDIGVCALLGSAAFVAGVLRRTVSLGVVLIEAVGATAIVPSLMLSMLASKSIADRFIPDLISEQSRIKELPFMPPHPKDITRGLQLQATDVMSKSIKSFQPFEMVINIINVLQSCQHSAFPVIDAHKYKGIVTRQQLIACLKAGDFHHQQQQQQQQQNFGDSDNNNNNNFRRRSPTRHRFHQSEVVRKVATSTDDDIDDIPDIHQRYMNHYVNLWPYILPNPVVEADTPFEMAYDIFRTLALRSLPVVHHFVEVVGMISRNDCLNVEAPVLRRLNQLSQNNDSSYQHHCTRDQSPSVQINQHLHDDDDNDDNVEADQGNEMERPLLAHSMNV